MKQFALIFAAAIILVGCKSTDTQAPVSLTWEVIQNDIEPGVVECTYTLTNNMADTLFGDFTIYWSHMSVQPMTLEGEELHVEQIQASYHMVYPTADFQPLAPGESKVYTLRYRGNMIRENCCPQGAFIDLHNTQTDFADVPLSIVKFSNPKQWLRGIPTWEKTPYADGEYMYTYNARLAGENTAPVSTLPENEINILPRPKNITYAEGTCRIKKAVFIEKNYANFVPEGYAMRITPDTIFIDASGDDGIFYAHKTLEQIGDVVPCCNITDWPDLHHRGIMLDISRNYTRKEDIMTLLDEMSRYKLNVFHFHITDDEAWRLEIPGFPQLTDCGSRRGFTTTETDCLYPMYNGGWDPNTTEGTANGYLTRQDFIDLLVYARERYIRIIPEIDLPGHMRAAKKSFAGLLDDSIIDSREYLSAQHYTDNVIAINQPFAVTFMETVIMEIKKMYQEAGCEFTIFNIGGDEVPNGALTREEHQAYIDAIYAIMQREGLQPMGWEEISHFMKPEQKPLCVCWHAGDKKPLELIEQGYPVVLGAVNSLYLDMCYVNHQEERGLWWGGYTDEYKTFEFQPISNANVVGMQGQLWAETIRNFPQVQCYLFPKMLGLVERAWNNGSALTLETYNECIWKYEAPKLMARNVTLHITQPGIHIAEGAVSMNTAVLGGTIRYTTDGSDVTAKSPVYTAPFTVAEGTIVKAKVFFGKFESATTWYYPEMD